jgi:hypothetical protein
MTYKIIVEQDGVYVPFDEEFKTQWEANLFLDAHYKELDENEIDVEKWAYQIIKGQS